MSAASQQSPWQAYTPRIATTHQHWLTDTGSLTLKLKRHSREFKVIRSFQGKSRLHLSEQRAINLPLNSQVMSRNVILCCDQQPVVIGHTITALNHLKRDWPFFNGLGQNALGLALFFNPLIRRSPLQYTRLCAHDMLYQLAQQTLRAHGFDDTLPPHLWARRGLFRHQRRAHSRMMVTEIMLPAVYQLQEIQADFHSQHP